MYEWMKEKWIKAMHEILGCIPCNKVDDIMESVFESGDSFGELLDAILNQPFSVEDFIDSQSKEDDLTDLIFEKTIDGRVVFPLAGENNTAVPYRGFIGDQASRYHQESIRTHLYADLVRMRELHGDDFNMELAVLLHDAMKKYTAATNKRGEVCFYGHEKVSAYFAAKVYKQLGYSKEEAKPYIAMIHGHMLPKTLWSNPKSGNSDYAKYVEEFGQKQADMVILLSRCDTGIKAGDLVFRYVDNGREVTIDEKRAELEGEKIVRELSKKIHILQKGKSR